LPNGHVIVEKSNDPVNGLVIMDYPRQDFAGRARGGKWLMLLALHMNVGSSSGGFSIDEVMLREI
jgi:hypothetical protein